MQLIQPHDSTSKTFGNIWCLPLDLLFPSTLTKQLCYEAVISLHTGKSRCLVLHDFQSVFVTRKPKRTQASASSVSMLACKLSSEANQFHSDICCSLRNIVFVLFVLRWSRKAIRQLKGRGVVGTFSEYYIALRRISYNLLLRTPGIREKIQAQVADAKATLKKKLVPTGPDIERHLTLPAEGWEADKVRAELSKLAEMKHTRWEDGRVSGAVYHGGKELTALQTEAFGMFTVANPIHPDVFPGVRKMEAEVVAMVGLKSDFAEAMLML